MKVSWIGAGKMGLPMARHIAGQGHEVVVIDRSASALAAARCRGLHTSSDIGTGVQDARVVFTSLPDDAALLAVTSAVAACAGEGAILVDTSTVSLDASAKAAEILAAPGLPYLRVSVSGNATMAEQAALTLMASGPSDAYEDVEPLLACFGPTRFYLGDAEQARLMKLVVNLMIAVTSGMLAESLVLGAKGGLDWAQTWDVIANSAVGSPIVKAKAVALRVHDYTPTFTVDQMRKDVGLILAAGSSLDVPMPLIGQVEQMLRSAAARGDGELDYAAIIRTVERASGLSV